MRIAPWLVVCLLLGACALQPGIDLPARDGEDAPGDGSTGGGAINGSGGATATGGAGGHETTLTAGAAGMGGAPTSTDGTP